MALFNKPSQAEDVSEASLLARGELFDGLGRRRIIHPDHVGEENPKLVGYTRATSYIAALEDTTQLQKWRTRLILEGAAEAGLEEASLTAYQQLLNDEAAAEALVEELRQQPRTITAQKKAIEQPGKDYRSALDEIAERSFFLAGGRDKADYGTAHHELVDRWLTDRLEGSFIREMEERWPGISDDFIAFQDSWGVFAEETGARVEMSEALVVNDKLQVAGRTDLILRAKLPGDERSRRCIADLKTGSIAGEMKLSQQLDMYATSKLYDPETGVRTPLRVRSDVGLILHAPKGERQMSVKLVQLRPGRAANALCAKVRASRRKVPGLLTDLVTS